MGGVMTYEGILGKKYFQKWKVFQSRQIFEITRYNKVDKLKRMEGVIFFTFIIEIRLSSPIKIISLFLFLFVELSSLFHNEKTCSLKLRFK